MSKEILPRDWMSGQQPDAQPKGRTGIRLLYAAFILLSLLAVALIVAIIITFRLVYLLPENGPSQ